MKFKNEEKTNKDKASNLGNLNPEEEKYLYNLGVSQMQLGRYEEGLSIFQLLLVFNPNNNDYNKSLAGCYHVLNNHRAACMFYHISYLISKDVDCFYYMADCLVMLQQFEEAQIYLEQFLNSESKSKFLPLIAKAKILQEVIVKRLEKKNRK